MTAGSSATIRFAVDVPERDRPLVERLLVSWGVGGDARVAVLTGGANNRNYVVRAEGECYALRIANDLSERLAVDRARAVQAQRDAAAAGLAPAVVRVALAEGHLLSEFLDGETLDPETVRDPERLPLIGSALRDLHCATTACGQVSPFADVRQWMALAESDGTAMPEDAGALLEGLGRVEAAVEAAALPWAFCHNDVVPMNLMLVDGSIRFVDWDYGGQSRAAFEIASFANTATLDDERLDVLLDAYDPATTDAQRAMVSLLRFVAALREASWALMAAPLLAGETAAGDFSYQGWYEDNVALARENLSAADFADRLETASAGAGSRAW